MVNEFINIENFKFVQGVMHRKRPFDKVGCTIGGNQMGSAKDGIKMDYSQVWPSILLDLRFHLPEAYFIIWFITNDREPLNEGRWITCALMHKRKEEKDTSNLQPTYPW